MQLTERINQTQLQEKDPDAQNLLGRELGANSDALYIMAQTLLVQNMALEQLKTQVAQLRQAPQQPAHASTFLGRLFGDKDEPQTAAQTAPLAAPQPQYQQPQQGWQAVPNYQQGQPQYQQPQYAAPQYAAVPVGQPSFLRGAMQTAAGVAAGALVFEGVESLMHGFGHGGFGGGWGGPGFGMGPAGGFGGGFGGGFERPVEETVVNNYYDQPGGSDSHVHEGLERDFGSEHRGYANEDAGTLDRDSLQFASADSTGSGANESAAQFDQGAYDNSMENDTVAADNSVDNVQIDDSGSGFDDGGGGFDSSGDQG
jgi:hypothetical protein